eukprot:gene11822-8132_t
MSLSLAYHFRRSSVSQCSRFMEEEERCAFVIVISALLLYFMLVCLLLAELFIYLFYLLYSVPPHLPMSATVRFEWFQTPTSISLVFFVKDRTQDDLHLEASATALEIIISLRGLSAESGKEYQYSVSPVFAPLKTAAPKVVIKPMKIEITLEKETAFHWPSLEGSGDGVIPAPAAASTIPAAVLQPTAGKDLPYPNSKGRDWSSFDLKDEDEKPEGEAALQNLFQQIYGNGTDEQRKAMIKSFTESCGTVLSTNWEDVGSRQVTVEPPTGMEAKKVVE